MPSANQPSPPTQETQEVPPAGVSIDWVKVLAGALAAMASAVLLSTLGAAGTVVGAALGSVIVTVGNSVFSRGIDVSKQGVSAAQAMALRRVTQARSQVGRAQQDQHSTGARDRLSAAERELHEAEAELRSTHEDPAPATAPVTAPRWRGWSALSWKRVALAAAGVFVAAMVVITGFELVSGKAVSQLTGGSTNAPRTSWSGLTGGGPSTPTPSPTPTPTPSTSPGASPTATPSGSASPSADTSPGPGADPSADPSATSEPTADPTPSAVPSTGDSDPGQPDPAESAAP